jgi:tRNA dimethylallyltransferase
MATTNKDTPVMITILGPTATGKTRLAALVAHRLPGEVISADSRQVYRNMNLGTGKDYDDYLVDGRKVPYHLVDIVDPGYEYNVFEFQEDFLKVFDQITAKGKVPVLCGGTGMYLEAALSGYQLVKVPENPSLRQSLQNKSLEELKLLLEAYRPLHNTTDITDHKRAVRAIEVAMHEKQHPEMKKKLPAFQSIVFGISLSRNEVRERITRRLKKRLDDGMADEVKNLLESGLTPQQVRFYGLEYRYLTDYVTGEITYEEMFRLLNTAIHQFAKRQMTWFRRMERKGVNIRWLNGNLPAEENAEIVVGQFKDLVAGD